MAFVLPDVQPTIRDGGLGISPASTASICLKIGPSLLGLVNTIYSAADIATLTNLVGQGGPLAEAAAYSLAIAGGPVYCVPANPTTYGSASAVSQYGSGPAVTVAVKPAVQALMKVVLGGALATATVSFSVDGGVTWSPAVLTAATMMVSNETFVTLALTGGVAGAFVTGDIWTIPTTGGVPTLSGTGTGTVTISSCSPVDAYTVQLNVVAGGALGAGTFQYSLDGGYTWSQTLLIPASGTYVVPLTGLVLTFAAGTYVAGTSYQFTTTAASYSTTDLGNAMTAILADPRTWGLIHVIGAPSSSALSASLAASVDTQLATAASGYRYARAFIECYAGDTDVNLQTAFASTTSLRVAACAGTELLSSPINGRDLVRSSAWVASARAAKVPISEDLGRIATGACLGVVKLLRDEQATPALDAARFTTLRTVIGRTGFYVTNGRLLAAPTSDFVYLQYGRVMDVAAAVARQALLFFLNDSVRVNAADGTIYEKDARNIEQFVDSQLRAALTTPGYASDVQVVVNRSANILSTQQLPVTVRVIPLGYAKFISLDIGFLNPALVVK